MTNYYLVPLTERVRTLDDMHRVGDALTAQFAAVAPASGSISGRPNWETSILPAMPADPVPPALDEGAPTHQALSIASAEVLPETTDSVQTRTGAPRAEDAVGADDPIVARLLAVGVPIEAENQRIERDKWRFRLRLAVGATSVGGAILAVGAWLQYYN